MQPVNRLEFKIAGQSVPLISLRYEVHLDSPCGSFNAKIFNEQPFEETSLLLNKSYLTGPKAKDATDPLFRAYNPSALVGKKATIMIDGKKINAIIEAIDFSPMEAVEIAGRDQLSLIVDSSANPREYQGKQDLLNIAQDLCAAVDVGVSTSILQNLPVENFTVSPGDTIFQSLEQAAANHHVFFASDDGLILRIIEKKETNIVLDSQSPVTNLRLKYDVSERFGTYVMRSTSPQKTTQKSWLFDGVTKGTSASKELVFDDEINSKKLKIITLANLPKSNDEKRRLEWEMTIRKMKSFTLEITLAGISFFEIGTVITVDLPLASGTFLVKSLSFAIDGDSENFSETTTLFLISEHIGHVNKANKTPIRKPKPKDKSSGRAWLG